MGRKTITMMLRKARSIGRKKELALTWADQRQADIFVLVKRLEAAISRNDHDDITIATGRLQELIGRTYEALPRVLDELSKTPVIDGMGGDLTECGAASLDECLDWAQGQIATGQALLTRLYQAEHADLHQAIDSSFADLTQHYRAMFLRLMWVIRLLTGDEKIKNLAGDAGDLNRA